MNAQRVRQTWVGIGVLLGLCVHAHAAKYPLVSFPQLHGVSTRDVLQDSRGSIWLATDRGLWRWSNDGFVPEVHRFRTRDPTKCLFEDEGVLWVGTADGLVGVDLAATAPCPGPPELRGVAVYRLVRDVRGRVWCATNRGLYRLRVDAEAPAAEIVPGTRGRDIYSVAVDTRGVVWAGAGGALLCYDANTLRERFTETFAGREVRGLAVNADGALWIGLRGPGGVFKLEEGALVELVPPAREEAPEINVIIPHPGGEVWLGTERGVLRWTGQRFIAIDHNTGLAGDAVQGLYVDREELVWIATRSGVYQLRSPYILTYDVHDGLPHPVVQVVLPRPNGDFIVGTAAGLCRMNAAGRIVQGFNYLGSVEVLCADESGRLWVGGRDGLVCYDETSVARVNLPYVRGLRNVTAILPHEHGGIWVCTASGLWQIDGEQSAKVRLAPGPTGSSIHLNGMYRGPDGTVYLATQTGLLKRGDDGRWNAIPSGRAVHSLATDLDGTVWIGTSQGLMTLEGAYCRDFSRRGAPHGKVTDITVDHDGALWIATSEGVYRYHNMRFSVFSKADGLPATEVHSVRAVDPGVLLVGTSQGLAIVESDRISPSRAPPRVAITVFKAGGEQYVIGGGALEVPNWQRNVSVSFRGIGFRQDQESLRYRSRLVGFDDEWSAPSPEPGRSYTNLPWGSYKLQVRAINAQGVESDQIASLSFSIGPPVWLDPWFVAGCAIVLTALTAWIVATQRHKRRLQRAAEAANVAKSEFLAKVSHEIRTPLTVILGCIERLADPKEPESCIAETLDTTRRSSNHLLGLINDLLDLSKIEVGRLSVERVPVSVHELLTGVDAIMRVNAEQHGLDFRIVYDTEIPELIVTDPGRLRQALINLVGNAIKFTPQGRIRIRVRLREEPDGRWLAFDVEDTGVGVPPEKMDVIFDAFSQAESFTSRRFAGTGLGLAITKSIAERLNGRVTARSEVGKGSTFTLAIDLSKTEVETLGKDTRMVLPADLTAGRPLAGIPDDGRDGEAETPVLCGRVLLAEDAEDISHLMRLQLESAGARVTVVDNGADAVEQAYDGRYDVVIMDIHMPGMNGIAAIREMRARGLETPIIVISADSSENRHRECDSAGADGFIPKPFQKLQLLTEVRRHLSDQPNAAGDGLGDPIRSELDLTSPKMAAAVAEFARTLKIRVSKMENALERQDAETVTRLAHQLKGAGGIHGYMCVTDHARQIEESLARDDRARVRAGLRDLRGISERILDGLRLEKKGDAARFLGSTAPRSRGNNMG